MNDFFAPTIPAEQVLSDRLHIEPIIGDGWEPRLRGGYDYVLVAPVNSYQGDGTYLLYEHGAKYFRRLYSCGQRGKLRCSLENPLYGAPDIVDLEGMNEIIIGIVVADIKVQDERFLRL